MTPTDEAPPSSAPCARILLAEDDADFRTLVSSQLRGAGFDVTEAHDGQDLLERLIDGSSPAGAYNPFDMVLSDIDMPHLNALDVLVGARSYLTTTPVVLMTSFGDAQTHAQAMRLGVAAVLDKPLRLDDLSARLVQILNEPQRGSSGAKPPAPAH